MLKTYGFPRFLIVFYSIAVSFLSVYVYTPSGRRTTISAPKPRTQGGVFGHILKRNKWGMDLFRASLLLCVVNILSKKGRRIFLRPFSCRYIHMTRGIISSQTSTVSDAPTATVISPRLK